MGSFWPLQCGRKRCQTLPGPTAHGSMCVSPLSICWLVTHPGNCSEAQQTAEPQDRRRGCQFPGSSLRRLPRNTQHVMSKRQILWHKATEIWGCLSPRPAEVTLMQEWRMQMTGSDATIPATLAPGLMTCCKISIIEVCFMCGDTHPLAGHSWVTLDRWVYPGIRHYHQDVGHAHHPRVPCADGTSPLNPSLRFILQFLFRQVTVLEVPGSSGPVKTALCSAEV